MQSCAASSSASPDTHALHTLRAMQASDLAACYGLTQALQWPHRLQDWQFVQALGHGFVIEHSGIDKQPAVAGSGLVWHYGTTHAALGMVIVANALQGLGLGRQLMQCLLSEAGARSVLLNATVAGQPLYEKLGFIATGELYQHQGTVTNLVPVALPSGLQLRPRQAADLPQLLALEQRASGLDRAAVMSALLAVSEAIVIERDGLLCGFSLLRAFGRGRAIGPVVAPDMASAQALISHWMNTYRDTFVRIDVPERSNLSAWLNDIGLARVDTVVSMCKGTAPGTDPQYQLYSLINQALG